MNKGFSMVELLVSVAIFSFMLVGIYGVLGAGNNIYTTDMATLDMSQQVRNAMDRLVREVRESNASTVTVLDTNNDRITFSTPNETGIQYYRSGTNFIREYPSGTTKIIASNMARFKCTKTGTLLKIDMRADKTMYNKTFSAPLVVNVRLRNE